MPALTIREFCDKHRISVPTYYALKAKGLAPREMRLGTAVRISPEADEEWRRARENPVAEEADAVTKRAGEMRKRAHRAARQAVASLRHVSKRHRDPKMS